MSEVVLKHLILAFDTATTHCSIALTSGGVLDGVVIGSVDVASDITHSRRLLDSLDWLLRQTGVSLGDIGAVAVGLGPGSFTGLRIGMATAKGLCHGAGLPLLGVSTLDAIGCAIDSKRLICVVQDARKKEVYSRFYRCREDGMTVGCSALRVCRPQDLAATIDEPVLLAGDGVGVHDPIWTDLLGDRLQRAAARFWFPRAEMVGLLAAADYHTGAHMDLDSAVPLYVRSSDAELSLVMPTRTIAAANQQAGVKQ